MAKDERTERLLAERFLAERALRELPSLRALSRAQALHWLNTLVFDIRQAENVTVPISKHASAAREKALVAIGLVGIALDSNPGRQSDLDALWDSAIERVGTWHQAVASKIPPAG